MSSRKIDGGALLRQIRELILGARRIVAHNVDTIQVLTNFEIGRRIIDHEQQGNRRATYVKATLKGLSVALTPEFGRGYSEDNLSNMRKFYLMSGDQMLLKPEEQTTLTSQIAISKERA